MTIRRPPRPGRTRARARALLAATTALLLAIVALGLPPLVVAAPSPAGPADLSISTIGSPFSPNRDGINDALLVDVTTAVAATISVTVRDFDGKVVRRLATDAELPAGTSRWTWNGRDAKGRRVADGPYRIAAAGTIDGLAVTAERIAAKAPNVPYGTAPGEIVVALNAGHGTPDPGAVYGGIREADMNLDIAQRLRAMLEASGVTVVMIRETDAAINDPLVDVSGNGTADHADELIARNDVANLAAADVYVTLMNNAYGCHCVQGTETYTSDRRTWSPEGTALARFIQGAHLERLKAFRTKAWRPTDRGVRFHDFFGVRPYSIRSMPRPSLMPSVLVESLFMDQPAELATLARRPVRTALAAAYFDGITRYLANREYGLRYELLDVPAILPAGEPATARLRIINRGNQASAGWILQARIVASVPFYYARPKRGTLVGSVPIPDGLAPGQAVELDLPDLPLPPQSGDWIVLFDVVPGGGRTMADRGVVAAQWRLTLSGPDPSPSPEPSAQPSTLPSTQPSASPAGEPSTAPSVAPSLDPSAAPSLAPSAPPSDAPPSLAPSAPPSEPPSVVLSMPPSPAPDRVPPETGPAADPSDPPPARSTPSLEPPMASPDGSPAALALAALAGRGDGGPVPVPTPGGDGDVDTRMRIWRRTLPFDALADAPGPAAAIRWPARAAFRRGTVPIDIPIESRAGMDGIYGHDHPH
jgi:N-acetylmuramoyl-L-alanine amidase